MHRILAKYWQNYIHDKTFGQFSSLTLSNIGKNNKIQRIYLEQYLKTTCPIWLKF